MLLKFFIQYLVKTPLTQHALINQCQIITERERTIWISTNHDALNENFSPDASIVDILPSIAKHLGLSMPDDIRTALDGQSFID